MTPHLHRAFVPGCYRCELGLDENSDVPLSALGELDAGRTEDAIRENKCAKDGD